MDDHLSDCAWGYMICLLAGAAFVVGWVGWQVVLGVMNLFVL